MKLCQILSRFWLLRLQSAFILSRKNKPDSIILVSRAPTAEMLAYLDFSVSTTGMLAGIKMSHASTTALCRAMKLQCELYPSR